MREAAHDSLGKVGRPLPKDKPVLKAVLKEPDEEVRLRALEALFGMEMDAKEAAPLYAELLGDEDKQLRLEAARRSKASGRRGTRRRGTTDAGTERP